MGTATPFTATDALGLPPMAESQLGGSYINNPQVHDSSNVSVCSSDSNVQENLKSHFNNRLSDKIYNTFRELFSNVDIDSV